MAKVLYTAEAHVVGGRVAGHGRTSDGVLEADDVAIDSKVMLVTGENRSFTIAVELAVTLPSVEGEHAVDLVRKAHAVCPYSNATRGNIEMTLSANGAQVDL